MNNDPDPYDVAIVGGSFAGLTAALYLARARRRVVIFDTGVTRNRFADAGHGFLGMDGHSPEAMRMAGRADVLAYPTITLREERVARLERQGDLFRLDGVLAHRVILAYGMRDVLPAIPGLQAGWGQWAMQCPYCHGYEAADLPTGVMMTSDTAPHHLSMLRDLTHDQVLFTNGYALTDEVRADVLATGVPIHDAPVVGFDAVGGLQAVLLADGTRVPRQVLYLVTRSEPSCDLAAQIGCQMADGPMGAYVKVGGMQQTSVPGVWSASDLNRPAYGAVFAASDGAMAGVSAHHSFHFPTPPFA